MSLPWNEPPSISQITDKLYLSNESGAHHKEMLEERKITHILVAGNYIQQKFPKGYQYFRLPILDKQSQEIIPFLKAAYDFIEEGEKVLVHCSAGISRSASVVIGYLMLKNKWGFKEAFEYVKERRPIVCPNEGFVSQLESINDMIKKEDFELAKLSTKGFEYKKLPPKT